MTERSPWILSRRDDLAWFHGSALLGLALLGVFLMMPPLTDANYGAMHPAVWALLLWGVCFDGTHVLGTYARSYLAPDAGSRAALPGRWSWLIVAVGPALAVIDKLLLPQGPSQLGSAGPLFQNFLLVAYLWAYWHLVRQHYGLLVLYHRRSGADVRLNAAALWVGTLYPYLRFSLGEAYARSGLPVLFPAEWLPSMRLGLDVLAAGVGLVLISLYAVRRRRPGPAELLVAVVTGLHLLVFAVIDNLLLITAILTIFHNVQYHRLVWQYERGLGRAPLGGLGRYVLLGGLFGLLWYGPRILGVATIESSMLRNVLLGLGWGVALHHYYVDGRIWRVRRHAHVGQALDRGAGVT